MSDTTPGIYPDMRDEEQIMSEAQTPIQIPPADPMALLQQAISSDGIDPDRLGKLMDLAERWRDDQARMAYAQAMMQAQHDMPVIIRDRANTHTNSRYASLENIQSQIKDIYLRHGLTVSFSETEIDTEGWIRIQAVVTHRDGHSETFYQSGPIDDKGPQGKAVKTGLHGSQSTRSYLQRTLLCAIFALTIADQDKDGNRPVIPINEAQVAEINSLCEAVGDDLATLRRLLNAYQIEKVEELPAAKFRQAKTRLEATIAKQRNGGGS